MSTPKQWAQAYARQAQADLRTWHLLQLEPTVPSCHRLLFLQMACEKLSKAHLCMSGSQAASLQSSHAYSAKCLPKIIGTALFGSGLNARQVRNIVVHAKHIAQEIEYLAPAVKRGGQRLDNCEYPWEDHGGQLHVPLDWTFESARLLVRPAGRTFLKLVHDAVQLLATPPE